MEGGAVVFFAGGPDGAAHEFGEAFGDGEAEGVFFLGGGEGCGAEGLEEGVDFFFGEAGAVVFDLEMDFVEFSFEGFGFCGEGDFSFFSEADGVVEEVDEDLAQAFFVAEEGLGDEFVDRADDVLVVGEGFLGDPLEGAFDAGAEVEWGAFDFEFAGFDFVELKDVFDDGVEGFDVGEEGVGLLALFWGELCVGEVLEGFDDFCDGGVDGVGDVAEEFVFDLVGDGGFGGHLVGVGEGFFELGVGVFELLVGGFEGFFDGAEFVFGVFAFGDVGVDGDVADELFVFADDGRGGDGEPSAFSVFRVVKDFAVKIFFFCERGVELFDGFGVRFRAEEEVAEFCAHDFVGGVAHEGGEGLVAPCDEAGVVGDEDGVADSFFDEEEALGFVENGGWLGMEFVHK